MPFRLPNTRELTYDQNQIINLRIDRDWVIQGAPGTGKSVMVLFRAAQIAQQLEAGEKVLVLVYNRPLKEYLNTAIANNRDFNNCTIETCHRWIWRWYQKRGLEPPLKNPEASWSEYDYSQIAQDWESLEPKDKYAHIIVDEAQDFSKDLFEALQHIAKAHTYFIDPNQRLKEEYADTSSALIATNTECPFKLSKNFRNTKQVLDLAKVFWNGEGELAETDKQGPVPRLIKTKEDKDTVTAISSIIENNRQKSIGIIVNQQDVNDLYSKLTSTLGQNVSIEYYSDRNNQTIDFSKSNPKILTYGTMKGLEFDLLIVPFFERVRSKKGDIKTDNNRIYVALTRAFTELFILYSSDRVVSGCIDTLSVIKENTGLVEAEEYAPRVDAGKRTPDTWADEDIPF